MGTGSASPSWKLVSDELNVLCALARRYRTTRGTLFYDSEYGFNLLELVGEDVSEAQLAIAKNEIALEAEKDERVLTASADVASNPNGTLTVTVSVTLRDGETFTLVLAVSALTVEIVAP